jgi:hypothetical protein
MEFHIARSIRERLEIDDLLFGFSGNVVFADVAASRRLAERMNTLQPQGAEPVNAGALFAMGLIDELNHALIARYRTEVDPAVWSEAIQWVSSQVTATRMDGLVRAFTDQFPNVAIFRGKVTVAEWLRGSAEGMPNREAAFEELLLLWLANINPAFTPFKPLFDDTQLKKTTAYQGATTTLPEYFATRPPLSPEAGSLLDALRAPMLASPDSLTGQLDFIRETWTKYLGEDLRRVLLAIDVLREEEIAIWMRFHPAGPDNHRHAAPGWGGEGFRGDEFIGYDEEFGEYVIGPDGQRTRRYATDYQAPLVEYEAFSADQAWMPNVVLIAKSTYVWLEQLSKKYQRHIHRLDQIPQEELRILASRGVTGLWLIGLWERSKASRTIKRLRGNADAVASAYSLKGYEIAEDIGGERAYEHLRDQAAAVGLRLASDMVPNHMGIDSDWVIEHPDWFLYRDESPFPVYRFDGPDLSTDSRVEIKIEDHYYDQTDAAVVFRLRHLRDNRTRYMYHGNDGTTFAWNDTAQLDYSKADVREHVMQTILDVARRFPIIRFDAAMVLAKRHVQRLWFPLPGAGGSIPSRAENAVSQEEFDALMPAEFWREVVDRVAVEVPGTLLLAEAFWLLEGYFVRTLGMHRVYNSAFMNMLRDEENAKYRSYLKKTVEFDPDILKRYVNFMSNPDEKTAIDQFGDGDKYFGVCALLATLPGLPMLGHGQVEGYAERYGMDFKQARMDEQPNEALIARHQHEIAPLLKNRALFADSVNFVMYDFWTEHGTVDENVFAYSNRVGNERAVILYNNTYGSTSGTIHVSVAAMDKGSGNLRQTALAEGLALPWDDSMVLAYRDPDHGLEYLRRARDLHEHGLTLDLRGYQHVVLLHWRELRSTATHPWDRLCDALNGSGVHSVDEALSKMRLRPLHESLHAALSPANLHAFAEAAKEPVAEVEVEEEEAALVELEVTAEEPEVVEAEPAADVLAPELQVFVEKAAASFEQVLAILPGEQRTRLPDTVLASPEQVTEVVAKAKSPVVGEELDYRQRLAEAVAAVVRIPVLLTTIAPILPRPGCAMLPSNKPSVVKDRVWAPVLAWLLARSLLLEGFDVHAFDTLQCKSAFAEIFSAVAMDHETAWRAAARVRLLLVFPEPQALESMAFWSDPDARWLLGANESGGVTYFNKECFEEMVCWLQLPALLAYARQTDASPDDLEAIGVEIEEQARKAERAGYNLKKLLTPDPLLTVAKESVVV